MKNIKILQERIKKLQAEIKQAEQEKIKEAGRITLSIFKKESDLNNSENFLKFKEQLLTKILNNDEVKNNGKTI
jgi:hypothetical protein